MALLPPDPQVKPYHFFFRNVFFQRMKYVNKIAFYLAVLLSVLFVRHETWSLKIFGLVYEVPIFTVAFLLLKYNRLRTSTVAYSQTTTLALHLLKTVSCGNFWFSVAATAAAATCIFLPFLRQSHVSLSQFSKEYRHKPLVNDQLVYFFFHGAVVGLLYCVQDRIFQRSRLSFSYGTAMQPPAQTLFSRVLLVFLVNSVLFTALCAVLVPFFYALLHSTIYRTLWPLLVLLGLDTKSALWGFFRVSFLCSMAAYTFLAALVMEFFNHAFNTYATVGCLHHNKPISHASTSPVITLLSGVRDVRPSDFLTSLLNLSAFQELAYIASSADPEAVAYRNRIFNLKSTVARSFWPSILDECSLVIKDTTSRINYRSPSDLQALRTVNVKVPESPEEIFGNSRKDASFNDFKDSFKEPSVSETFDSTLAISATSSPVKKYDNPQQAQMASSILKAASVSRFRALLLRISRFLDQAILVPLNQRLQSVSVKPMPQTKQIHQKVAFYRKELLDLPVGVFWRVTLKRDAEARVPNPVNYGNAVLTLSGLLLRSIEEDRSNTITNAYLSEVLNLLEKPVRASANYTDYVPASIYLASTNNHLVALMHDLTVKEYYQISVKFNYKVNDLQLSPRAFKLTKWVIATSIASAENSTRENALYI